MANGILTLNPNFPERNPEGEKLPLIEAPVGAGIGLALANFLKDKNKENLPEKIDEDKKKEEPPEDPDFIPEILKLKEIDDDDNPRLDTPDALNEEGKIVDLDKLVDMEKFDIPFVERVETERQDAFPFSIKDFKGGALDNKAIKKTFQTIMGDIDFTGGQSFDDDKFLVTPPRGQQKIALKFLKEKLIEDKANPKIIDHITTLQKELSERIENTGYYGAGEAEKTPIGNALIEGMGGYVKDLKRKKNAKGGFIDKALSGGNKYI
tara:strand:+ start:60 stop:854 length:795 start_codon:yes stop_codon:yes gene_type:complete